MKRTLSLLTVFFCILFLIFFHKTDIKSIYKENWNFDIPNPIKKISPIEHVGAGDILAFDIMYYNKNDIKQLISMKEFQKVNQRLENFYNKDLEQYFFCYLEEGDLKIFTSYFNKSELFKENNFYVILEKNTKYRYSFNLLIIDTSNNTVYSISSNYGDSKLNND